MRTAISRSILICALLLSAASADAFTIKISGDGGSLGEKVESGDCRASAEEVFTGLAGNTVYTNEKAYSGDRAVKMTVEEGSTGFGSFGGAIDFQSCDHLGGRNLVKGDEVWIRTRIYFPVGFEFNSGRNKFMRLRAYHDSNAGAVSEGYNDLYINGHPDSKDFNPFWFIFEGEQNWYQFGATEDYFTFGTWKTVEMYLKLDNLKESEGGYSRVRVWVDGKLVGDTGERRTLNTEDSYVKYFSLFTYYGNETSPKTQYVYIDDFVLTTDTPESEDAFGNRFIGVGNPRTASPPNSPSSITVK